MTSREINKCTEITNEKMEEKACKAISNGGEISSVT
jgi:hypothetical protein